MKESVSSWGYGHPQLQDQSEIPVTVCLACVWQIWQIWCHKCTQWIKENGLAIGLPPLLPQLACNSLVCQGCCLSHATCCRKQKWGEGPMLNLNDPLLVCLPLLILIPPVQNCHGGFAVAWCKRVEHPCIKNAYCCLFTCS